MGREGIVSSLLVIFSDGFGTTPVSLDSCRQMALKNNKQLRIAEEKVKGAGYTKNRLGELISRE